MGLFDQFITVDIKKNMGIAGLTDEFFCVYLNSLLEKYPYLERVLHLPHGKKYSLCDLDIYKENLQIMKDASDYANEFNVKKIAFSSSATVLASFSYRFHKNPSVTKYSL